MTWAHSTIASDIQVPAFFCSDDAKVFGLRFSTFTGTTTDGKFKFVRRANALVAILYINGQAHTVLHAITTPSTAHAAFHCADGFAVGLPCFKACFYQTLPDGWQLAEFSTEQVNALATSDFAVKTKVTRHFAQENEHLRSDLTPGDAWHYRICAVFLHIGQEGIVSVLQAKVIGREDKVVLHRGKNIGGCRLANIAAHTLTMTF